MSAPKTRPWLSRRSLVLGLASGTALGGVAGALRFRVDPVASSLHGVQGVPVLGTSLSVVVRHPDRRETSVAIRSAVREVFDVHHMMTIHQPSPLTEINDSRGGREIPDSILAVLQECRHIHAATGGLFDPTLGQVLKRIEQSVARNERIPTAAELGALVEGGGLHQVRINPTEKSVQLEHPSAALDLNGIAKGYAVDRAAASLRSAGFTDFLVNAGGDLYAAGSSDPDSSGWQVHLESPTADAPPLHTFQLTDRAVATSGNTHRDTLANGTRIPHLVHPEKGVAVQTLSSVSALAPTAMQADGFSTALFVAHPTEARRILSEQANVQAWGVHPRLGVREI